MVDFEAWLKGEIAELQAKKQGYDNDVSLSVDPIFYGCLCIRLDTLQDCLAEYIRTRQGAQRSTN